MIKGTLAQKGQPVVVFWGSWGRVCPAGWRKKCLPGGPILGGFQKPRRLATRNHFLGRSWFMCFGLYRHDTKNFLYASIEPSECESWSLDVCRLWLLSGWFSGSKAEVQQWFSKPHGLWDIKPQKKTLSSTPTTICCKTLGKTTATLQRTQKKTKTCCPRQSLLEVLGMLHAFLFRSYFACLPWLVFWQFLGLGVSAWVFFSAKA